jgi:hypothetical protein
MKMKKLARLAGMLTLGWAVTIIAKLLITAIVASVILGIVHLIGTALQIRLPYKTIAVLATLVVLDVIKNHYVKRRTR